MILSSVSRYCRHLLLPLPTPAIVPHHPTVQRRFTTRGPADMAAVPPVAAGALQLLPPAAYAHQPATSFAIKFAGQAPSKVGSGAVHGGQPGSASLAACATCTRRFPWQGPRLPAQYLGCLPVATPSTHADPQQHQCGRLDARRAALPHRHAGVIGLRKPVAHLLLPALPAECCGLELLHAPSCLHPSTQTTCHKLSPYMQA